MRRLVQALLVIGALFYAFEAVVHALGLPILEHDKIFIVTHDRYIAVLALTYAALLALVASNLEKYGDLFALTMAGILISGLNAFGIDAAGGYSQSFPVERLDRDLSVLGVAVAAWYGATGGAWFWWRQRERRRS